jgi:hypothetical protein
MGLSIPDSRLKIATPKSLARTRHHAVRIAAVLAVLFVSGCGYSIGGPTAGLVITLAAPPLVPHWVDEVVFRVHITNTGPRTVCLDFCDGEQAYVRMYDWLGKKRGHAPEGVITIETKLGLAPGEHQVQELHMTIGPAHVPPGPYRLEASLAHYECPRTTGFLVVF